MQAWNTEGAQWRITVLIFLVLEFCVTLISQCFSTLAPTPLKWEEIGVSSRLNWFIFSSQLKFSFSSPIRTPENITSFPFKKIVIQMVFMRHLL